MGTEANNRQPGVIITIDGPAGTGKSTAAHLLARRLGMDCLDTGAMYRAAALVALEQNIDPADGPRLAEALGRARLRFDWDADPPRMMLGDRDVSARIRELDVGAVVSVVAAQTAVRAVLVEQQRRIAAAHPRLISEGRDQGSVVFPDAGLRFYLDADVDVRAGRRTSQLAEGGRTVDPKRVASEIVERDKLDASRSDGPLIRPRGAVEIDTGRLSVEEVVDVLERISRDRFPDAGFEP